MIRDIHFLQFFELLKQISMVFFVQKLFILFRRLVLVFTNFQILNVFFYQSNLSNDIRLSVHFFLYQMNIVCCIKIILLTELNKINTWITVTLYLTYLQHRVLPLLDFQCRVLPLTDLKHRVYLSHFSQTVMHHLPFCFFYTHSIQNSPFS